MSRIGYRLFAILLSNVIKIENIVKEELEQIKKETIEQVSG